MPGHYDRPKIRGGHGNTHRKQRHHGGNNTVTGWYWPNHITPPSPSPNMSSRGRKGMGGNNTVTGWYWPNHITPPDQVMSTEPDIVDPCQDLGSTCFTDTYGNCECYARTPGY